MTSKIATADARQAGANVLHTVYVNGEPVGTRRSQHLYRFAICHWVNRGTPDATVIVDRWSRNPKASGRTFAVEVVFVP